MKQIDIEKWNRREHFEFFSKLDDPFHGIVTEVDCTQAVRRAKANRWSVFSYYMHKSIVAVNRIDALRLRVIDGAVFQLDAINVGTTIGRSDGTFGFALVPFSEDFGIFNEHLQHEIKEVQNTEGLRFKEEMAGVDQVHYSTIPWTKFTGLTHASSFNTNDTVPRITFGRISEVNDRMVLPISIEANHGLVDGWHIAQFLEQFQACLNQ